MNPSKYEIFLKAAETGSFTRTAEYYQYTQSAISQTIKSMERELQLTLFKRTPGGLLLSDEGEYLVEAIREIVKDRHYLEELVSELHQTQSGIVRLGSYISVACHWLPGCIQAFSKIYPNIEFELCQEDDAHLLEALKKGIVDLLIISNPHKNEYHYETLLEDPFVLVLPKEHPHAKKTSLSLKELEGEAFIYIVDGYSQYIKKMFKEAGLRPSLKYNMIDDNAVIAMVEHGLGVGIMPLLVTLRTPFQVAVVSPVESISREIGLITRNNDHHTWAIKKFMKFTKEYHFRQAR